MMSVILVKVKRLEDLILIMRDLRWYDKVIKLVWLYSMILDYRFFEVLIIDLLCCLIYVNFILLEGI